MSSEIVTASAIPAESEPSVSRDALFERISADYGPALMRLARAHELDTSLQQDLLQEIHIAIWRSLPGFGGRCSLKTWVYRVAHNAAVSYVLRRKRRVAKHLVELDDIDIPSEAPDVDTVVDEERMLARLHALLPRLKPIDREVFVLYLEGLTTDEIADVAGLSRSNTATKLHRIRALLASQLTTGESS
jgi:RNA polymerase sigma-70 factor, ECF subfamily